jgi:hypothetical protein
LLIMFIVGAASSTTGHIIKNAANGTFVEHSGAALESWGSDLIHTVTTTLAAICVVGVVGAVVIFRSRFP